MSHKFQQQKGGLAPTGGGVRDFCLHKKTKIKVVSTVYLAFTYYCVKASFKQRRNPRLTLLTKVVEQKLLVQTEDHHLQSISSSFGFHHEIHR